MIKVLRQNGRLNEVLFMATISLFCFSISVFRFIVSDTGLFLFLNWNLFLAFIPWLLTTITLITPSFQKKKLVLVTLAGSWLLFFPNAPYILTDLFHLRLKSAIPVWFDLVLILSFAWSGLMFGFLSLWDMEKLIMKRLRPWTVGLISSVLLFIGSFGIYLGRYLRWNSWDLITEPFSLLYQIGDRLINPFQHPRTWGMTILMGVFLNIVYWSFRLVFSRNVEIKRVVE